MGTKVLSQALMDSGSAYVVPGPGTEDLGLVIGDLG